MATRRPILLVLLGVFFSLGASYRTPNFIVHAPNFQIAQQVGQMAEFYRKEKALLWLGQEMQNWPQPCPIQVKVTNRGSGGATHFAFDKGRVLGQSMNIEGSLERMLNSVLPHEITHTVFAYHFRCALPRWADEGGSVLSEDEVERNRHDQMVRQILNSGHAIPLRRLFAMYDYPRGNVHALYAQGYSVVDFLVGKSSRRTFLSFIGQAMAQGWDRAIQTHYPYRSVEELEQAWLQHLRDTKKQPPHILAQNAPGGQDDPNRRFIVRQTAPPAVPLIEPGKPTFRLQAPSEGWDEYAASRGQPSAPAHRPGYLPDPSPARPPVRPASAAASWHDWQPPSYPIGACSGGQCPAPAVRLGPPQCLACPQPSLPQPSGWIIQNPQWPGYPQ